MSDTPPEPEDEIISYNVIIERVVGNSVEEDLSVEGYGVLQEAIDDILKMAYEKYWG